MSDIHKDLNISEEFHTFLDNLTVKALAKDKVPFVGRTELLERVMETLLRRLKRNPLLVGRPGVGKTALITELAKIINSDTAPQSLRGKTILELSVKALLFSGNNTEKVVGNFEKLFKEIEKNSKEIILFLDEMDIGVNSDSQYRITSRRIFNLIRSYAQAREITIIGATTPENFYRHIKGDEVLSMGFSPIMVPEPDDSEMLGIFKGICGFFENHYSLTIPEKLFPMINMYSRDYIPHRAFPQKGVELLDAACSKAYLKEEKILEETHIFRSISDISKLPEDIVRRDSVDYVKGLYDYLKEHVIGQDRALEEISRILRLSRMENSGKSEESEGIFLFLGEPGVGKSFTAQKISEYLYGREDKLRVIDLDDYYSDSEEEPGKLNSALRADLIREVQDHPFSVVLFENTASADAVLLYNLGKVLNSGYVENESGRKHYITGNIFILSLTGIGEMQKMSNIGFIKGDSGNGDVVIPSGIMNVLEYVDEVIEFLPLEKEDLEKITRERIKGIRSEFTERFNLNIKVGEKLIDLIVDTAVTEGDYAHTLSRFLEREVRVPALDIVSSSEVEGNLSFSLNENRVVVKLIR